LLIFFLFSFFWWTDGFLCRETRREEQEEMEADWDLRYLKYLRISSSLHREHANSIFFHVYDTV
jgi:hypothetical protein